jgi:ABC-type multidrug transport system fused ATPase/permease subunit
MLPRHYDHVVGFRGGSLSSGQRQKIAIARALLCRPQLLVLDEATSNLDLATEYELLAAVKKELSGSTLLLITHRLANVQHVDRVIVMHDGHLIEIGTHDELLRKGGRYYRMARGTGTAGVAPIDNVNSISPIYQVK